MKPVTYTRMMELIERVKTYPDDRDAAVRLVTFLNKYWTTTLVTEVIDKLDWVNDTTDVVQVAKREHELVDWLMTTWLAKTKTVKAI